MTTLLKSATIIDASSPYHQQTKDILITDGVIVQIDETIASKKEYQLIELDNLHVSNGWFDTSVSFGEPGYEERETIKNGLQVAAKSGFTEVAVNPNTNPVIDNKSAVEFLINKRTKKFSSWLSYTFAENNYTFKTFTPDTFPSSLDITHSFSSAINYNITNNIKFSLGAILRSGTPYTKPVKDNETIQDSNKTIVNYDTPNKERHPNFFRINASGSYNFNLSEDLKSTIRIGFTNVTNRKNTINTYYVLDESNSNKAKEINTYSLPFIPNLSFRISF